jgi:hypothetical protein
VRPTLIPQFPLPGVVGGGPSAGAGPPTHTEPYASKGQRTLRNSGDGIYNSGGSQQVLDVAERADGYAATFNIALDNV